MCVFVNYDVSAVCPLPLSIERTCGLYLESRPKLFNGSSLFLWTVLSAYKQKSISRRWWFACARHVKIVCEDRHDAKGVYVNPMRISIDSSHMMHSNCDEWQQSIESRPPGTGLMFTQSSRKNKVDDMLICINGAAQCQEVGALKNRNIKYVRSTNAVRGPSMCNYFIFIPMELIWLCSETTQSQNIAFIPGWWLRGGIRDEFRRLSGAGYTIYTHKMAIYTLLSDVSGLIFDLRRS